MLRWMMICSFLICSLICYRSSPTRPQDVRRELMEAIEHDSRLYRACWAPRWRVFPKSSSNRPPNQSGEEIRL